MEKGVRVKMAVDFWEKYTGQTGTVVMKYTGLGSGYIIEWDDPGLTTCAVLENHLVTIDAHPDWDADDNATVPAALRAIIASFTRQPWSPFPLSADSSRETLIQWLARNDRNGCYTDEDCIGEGAPPVTLDEAWELLAGVFEDDLARPR